jgi:hypothetical protein
VLNVIDFQGDIASISIDAASPGPFTIRGYCHHGGDGGVSRPCDG